MSWLARERAAHETAPRLDLPARFSGVQLEDLPGRLQDVVNDYLERFPEVAPRGQAPLFLGRAETWKTAAAAVTLRHITSRYHVRCKFVSVPATLMQLANRRFEATTAATLVQWQAVPILLLDDFAVCERGTVAFEMLQSVVAARFDHMLPTLCTGNLVLNRGREAEDLSQHLGPLLARRLLRAATGFTLLLD